jgi:hypothetical protein
MAERADAPPGPEVWQAQNLRLIAFPREPQFAVRQNWWQQLTGADPENVLEKRQKQEREESGSFQGSLLTLSLDLLRIQWTVSPRFDIENLPGVQVPPVLGSFMEKQAWFRGLMEQWLQHCPPIHRLAFTASLLQSVPDHQAGYRMLDRYLRWVDLDPQSSEFLYRINRRANSTVVQGMGINRLSTWLVGKFAVVVRIVAGGHPEQQVQPTETFACAVELDINTAPEFQGPLPHADLPRIFAELVAAGVEIARRGDPRP